MTPRDQYAAAALQGLLAAETERWNYLDEENEVRDCGRTALHAADIAEAMAAEACRRWGHLGTFGSCGRCGMDLGPKPPPSPVRVP